jgi:hypothetical protein
VSGDHFIRKKYTFLNDFKVRQAICKIRISAHPLMIEIGRYKNLETEERLCKLCITLKIEDEYHEKKYFSIINPVSVFLSQGTLYNFQKILIIERSSLVNK